MRRGAIALCLALTCARSPAFGAPERPTTSSESEPVQSAEERGDAIELGGRIFVRESLMRTEIGDASQWRSAFELDDARVSVKARPTSWLKAELTVDFADGDADVRDGYIRLRSRDLRLYAGRFKRPMSLIALRSRWKLPSVERGLLATLQIDGDDLPFAGGRGIGLLGSWKVDRASDLKLTLAVFQNRLGTGNGGLDASDHAAQDGYARVEVQPTEVLTLAAAVAVLGHLREVGGADSFAHAAFGSLEAYLHVGGARLWAEGYGGKSPFLDGAGVSRGGSFYALRVLASFRSPLPGRLRWLEPFLGASFFDPSTKTQEDRNGEFTGGATLSIHKRLRLQLEVAERFSEGLSSAAVAGTALRIQLGMRFRQ